MKTIDTSANNGPAVPETKPVKRREIGAWAFFDFANSGYTTVVLTTIYSTYFVGVIGAGLEAKSPGSATFTWTLAIGAANLLVLLAGPVIGAIADRRRGRALQPLEIRACRQRPGPRLGPVGKLRIGADKGGLGRLFSWRSTSSTKVFFGF